MQHNAIHAAFELEINLHGTQIKEYEISTKTRPLRIQKKTCNHQNEYIHFNMLPLIITTKIGIAHARPSYITFHHFITNYIAYVTKCLDELGTLNPPLHLPNNVQLPKTTYQSFIFFSNILSQQSNTSFAFQLYSTKSCLYFYTSFSIRQSVLYQSKNKVTITLIF